MCSYLLLYSQLAAYTNVKLLSILLISSPPCALDLCYNALSHSREQILFAGLSREAQFNCLAVNTVKTPCLNPCRTYISRGMMFKYIGVHSLMLAELVQLYIMCLSVSSQLLSYKYGVYIIWSLFPPPTSSKELHPPHHTRNNNNHHVHTCVIHAWSCQFLILQMPAMAILT